MRRHFEKSFVISSKIFFGPWIGYVTQTNLLLRSRTNVVTVTASGMLVDL